MSGRGGRTGTAGRTRAAGCSRSRGGARLAAAVLVATAAVMLGAVAVPGTALASPAPARHGFGARRPVVQVSPANVRAFSSALPSRVDLTPWHVPVGDQGQLSSCVTWAVDYGMLGWYARRDAKGGTPFAPMYTYSQINSGVDAGSYPLDALELARVQGNDTRADYSQGDYDWQHGPTAAERRNALNYRIKGYHMLFAGSGGWHGGIGFGDDGVTDIKTALASGHPVAIGLVVRDGFEDLGGSHLVDNDTTTRSWGLHEVLALGYDATGLIIQNSWGTGWGGNGFARLSWTKVRADVDEAYTIDGFASLPAVARVTHLSVASGPTTGGTTVVITGSDLRGATAVLFGKVGSSRLVPNAAGTQLTVTAPAHAAGTVDVTVWKGVRSSAATPAGRFVYRAPGRSRP